MKYPWNDVKLHLHAHPCHWPSHIWCVSRKDFTWFGLNGKISATVNDNGPNSEKAFASHTPCHWFKILVLPKAGKRLQMTLIVMTKIWCDFCRHTHLNHTRECERWFYAWIAWPPKMHCPYPQLTSDYLSSDSLSRCVLDRTGVLSESIQHFGTKRVDLL